VKERDGLKTFYRHESSTPIHSIKLEGIVDSPIFNVLALINELDLYVNWCPPQLKEVKCNGTISRFKKFVYMRSQVPWPLHHRDCCMYGYGVDLLEEKGCIVITVRSCTENEQERHSHPSLPERHVRMDCKFGGTLLKPISTTRTHVTMLSNVDPKLGLVPYWILNFVTHQLSYQFFQMLRKNSMKMEGTEYEKRIQDQPKVYGELKDRLFLYFNDSVSKL